MFFRKKKGVANPGAHDSTQTADGLNIAHGDSGRGSAGQAGAGSDNDPKSTNTQFLTGDSGVDRRTVQVLLEAIGQVSQSSDLETLLAGIVDRSIEVTGAERGLLLMGSGSDSLQVRIGRSRDARALEGELRFSTTIAGKVLEQGEPVRATVQSESEALDLGRSVYDLKLRAVMCVPLAAVGGGGAQEESRGVLYVDSRAATRQFSSRDLALFAALAQHISIALENARLHLDSLEKVRLAQSLELASAIQRDLMPSDLNETKGYDVHGWYQPAEETAGDFYDFVSLDDGKLALAVGDVTGHGVGPALITAAAQASIQAYLEFSADPGVVVTKLNKKLCQRIDDGRFVTLYLGVLSPEGQLEGVNAGHATPLLWRKETGAIEELGTDGPALGMLDTMEFSSAAPLQMAAGDALLVYTDGITEARPPTEPDNFLGEEGVTKLFQSAAAEGLSAEAITQRLVDAALELSCGSCEDDMTVVVVRRS